MRHFQDQHYQDLDGQILVDASSQDLHSFLQLWFHRITGSLR